MNYYNAYIKLYGAAGAALDSLDKENIEESQTILKEAIDEVENMED